MVTFLASEDLTDDTATDSPLKIDDGFERWTNPDYPAAEVDQWFKKEDSLMCIGKGGVTASHINSLSNLIDQHQRVKVKLASDKLDPSSISGRFLADEQLASKAVLIELRRRGMLFGRKT